MITPRYYQNDADAAIWQFFESGVQGNPLVAMPTGTGKSLVIAMFICNVFRRFPHSRIIALTHVKELIAQNAAKLLEFWPIAPMGICSSGLRSHETNLPIIFGGVATVVKRLEALGRFDLMLVDEAHLMSGKDDSMYGEIIKYLKTLNPYLRVIGFTATPYRTGQGLLTAEGGLFTHVCYDITHMKAFNRLIDEGFMCTLIPKRTNTQLDISKVGISQGEFKQDELESAIDTRDVNYLACRETVQYASDRNAWLGFAAGIEHAKHVTEMFRQFGVPCEALHSKLKASERDRIISEFRAGLIRCVINNNVLTTGFDYPPLDLCIMLRPTLSTGLWVQMLGRFTRPSPETMKQNGLVLDFAANTARLGPINDPVIPRKKGTGAPGVAPIRICDQCGTYNHASARYCYVCGFEFPRQIHIQATAGTEELIRSEVPQVEQFRVDRALYSKFNKNGLNILRVNYVCGIREFNEIVCLEHSGYAGHKARDWWKVAMGTDKAPPTVDEAMLWVSRLAVPTSIHVVVNRKYPDIIKREYPE